jgi:hypothetical protein
MHFWYGVDTEMKELLMTKWLNPSVFSSIASSVLGSVFMSISVMAGAVLALPVHAQETIDKTNLDVKTTAAPVTTPANEGYWLILGGISRHSCRDCGFRESNPGLAVQWSPAWLKEYTESKDWRLSAGTYINSNDRHSLYVGAQWLPIDFGVVKAGVQAAVITNYKEKSILPTLLPTISVETKYVGADIFLVPKFPSVSSAVLLSFKVRY